MTKYYCYVDESGQDTLGKFFIVAILAISDEKEKINDLVTDLEIKSGKKNVKWNKTSHSKRMDFVSKLFLINEIKGSLYYSLYKGIGYDYLTILSIAKVINKVSTKKDQKIAVYVDGLTKSKVTNYNTQLRKLGIRNCKVKGVKKDENNVFIRVVDSVAGFVRLALYKKDIESKKLFTKMVKSKLITEL